MLHLLQSFGFTSRAVLLFGVAGIAAHLWPRCDARYDAG